MRRRPRPRDHRRLPVIRLLLSLIAAARVFFRSRADIALEVLALRQQLGVLKRKRPRPRLSPLDRLFWTVLCTTWSHWRDALVIVKPETVVGWHLAGFPPVLALDIPAARRSAEDHAGTSRIDSP